VNPVTRKPSPALVVALIALIAALTGTAIAAGPDAFTRPVTKSQAKKIATKQANKAIDRRQAGLRVDHANTAASATKATSADMATSAVSAETATTAAPLVTALIQPDGAVASAPAPKNLASSDVTAPSLGIRCFDLPFAPTAAAAMPEVDVVEDAVVSVDLVPPFMGCPVGSEAEMRITDAGNGMLGDEAIYIQFDG
jgi:hypothetical protein